MNNNKILKVRGRHGDLAINRIDKLPEGLKELKTGVLMEGEATGHHHTLVPDKDTHVHVFIDNSGKKYFHVENNAVITHPEHKTIRVYEGYYEVKIEEEYDPFENAIRKVAD